MADDESLLRLKRLYLQCVPAVAVPFDSLVPAGRVDYGFQDRLYNTILAKDATAYPPAESYTRRFLKFLINSLERNLAEDEELHDSILTLYSTLLSRPESSPDITKPTFITYLLPSTAHLSSPEDTQIIISERKSLLSADGHTGSRTWEAALALGELFLSPSLTIPKPLSECRILELGAGTAFTAILLSKLQVNHVLATDGDENVCEAIRNNISLNTHPDNIGVSQLFWGPSQTDSHIYKEDWDLVIGGDITYDTRDLPDLVYTLKALLLSNHKTRAKAIISATVRNENTTQEFEKQLSSTGLEFDMREVEQSGRQLWYYSSDTPIRIYDITLA